MWHEPLFAGFRVEVTRRKHLPAALTKQGTTSRHAQRNLPTAGSTGLVGSAPRRCRRLFYYRLRTRSMLCSRCSLRGARTGSALNQPRAQSWASHQQHYHHASCRQSTRASAHRIERIVQTASVFGIEPLWSGFALVARLIAAIAYPVVLLASSLERSPGKGRKAGRRAAHAHARIQTFRSRSRHQRTGQPPASRLSAALSPCFEGYDG
jgi:hypothetical protein